MTVALVDYGSGNIRSAAKALERAAREGGGDARVVVTDDPDVVRAADRVVLPGVGAFADCKRGVEAVDGLRAALEETVRRRGRPFLGFCVGMQLMAEEGREHGTHPGFAWMPGAVDAIRPVDPALKIPHMGWNAFAHVSGHPVLAGIRPGDHAYYVHSYVFRAADAADIRADTDYGGPVAAAIGRDNLFGTQFHPEKSQATGLRLLANFLAWRP